MKVDSRPPSRPDHSTLSASSSSHASRRRPTQPSRSSERREPILATVGLSQAEVTQVGGLSVPDYRGARAIQVSFNTDDAPNGGTPRIRSGLAVPLMDSSTEPGMLAVLTRTPDRRFSELDITSLENVLSISRPGLETSLEKREPDPVPERDPLTDLYDRPAFHALLDLEITRARGRREQLALLMLDIDRLTTINARIGHLAADDVLAIVARVLNEVCEARETSRAAWAVAGSASSSRRVTAATPRGSSSTCRRHCASARFRRSAWCRSRRSRGAPPEGRCNGAHRASRCRARARKELGAGHGRACREAAEP